MYVLEEYSSTSCNVLARNLRYVTSVSLPDKSKGQSVGIGEIPTRQWHKTSAAALMYSRMLNFFCPGVIMDIVYATPRKLGDINL